MRKRFHLLFILAGGIGILLATPLSALAFSASLHVPEKYTYVKAGERFYFDVDLKYPENAARKDLRLTYQILSDSQVIAETKTLKAVETQMSFLDYIVIPEGTPAGPYIIQTRIEDGDVLDQVISASFSVRKTTDEITLYFFIILSIILVIGCTVIWQIRRLQKEIYINSRKKR